MYRPWNTYCLYIDSKSSAEFHRMVQMMSDCYNNNNNNSVVVYPQPRSLVWQHSSLLDADLDCLDLLLKHDQDWKYYINIVGSEFPVITNYQLIQKIKTLSNNIGFVDIIHPWPEVAARWKYSHVLPAQSASSSTSWFGGYYSYGPRRTQQLKTPPPHNITIMYGIKNVLISREFSEFVINSRVGQDLRSWLRDVLVAVEHFYSTLATITVSDEGIQQRFDHLDQLNMFKMRKTFWSANYHDCHGEVRQQCSD